MARGGKRNPNNGTSGYLFGDTLSKFASCLSPDTKAGCVVPNARFHYVDIRPLLPPAIDGLQYALRFLEENWDAAKIEDPSNPTAFLGFALRQPYGQQANWYAFVQSPGSGSAICPARCASRSSGPGVDSTRRRKRRSKRISGWAQDDFRCPGSRLSKTPCSDCKRCCPRRPPSN